MMNDTAVTISGKLDPRYHYADNIYTYTIISDCTISVIYWQFNASIQLQAEKVEVRGFPVFTYVYDQIIYIELEAEVIEELE